jgi:hypothetical protein
MAEQKTAISEGVFSFLEKIIDSYGIGITLLCVIFYFVYMSYLKITPNSESKELIGTLLDRVNDLEDQVKTLSAKLEAQNKEMSDLRVRNKELELRLSIMESAHLDSPLPQWIKDLSGRMISINSSYVENFLKPLGLNESDYVGKMDVDVWGEDIGREFRKHDQRVIETKKLWFGVERVLVADGKKILHLIIKYPRYSGSTIVGIAGIALPNSMADVLIEAKKQRMREES